MIKFALGIVVGGIAIAFTPFARAVKAGVDIAIKDVKAEHENNVTLRSVN